MQRAVHADTAQAERFGGTCDIALVHERHEDAELTVRIVTPDEIRTLNREYRHLDRPTNILSFPFECPPEVKLPLIGDLVICMEILKKEAVEQRKTLDEPI